MHTAPNDWHFHLFPLTAEGEETLPLDYVTDRGLELVRKTERTGDHAHLGPALHWAHLLKYELGPGSDWPAVVNARTGEAIGEGRTQRPVELLEKLGEMLDTAEFDAAVQAVYPLSGADKLLVLGRDTLFANEANWRKLSLATTAVFAAMAVYVIYMWVTHRFTTAVALPWLIATAVCVVGWTVNWRRG